MIKWSPYMEEETILTPEDKPLAVRCADGRIFIAEDSRVGNLEHRKCLVWKGEIKGYEKTIETIEVVWSGHRDDGYLCRGIY